MSPGRRDLVAMMLVAAAALAALWPVLDNGFTNFDDDLYVTENRHVRQGVTAGAVAWSLTATRAANWHPLTWISHMIDWSLYGPGPRGHHATSLLLHALDAALLYLLLVRASGRAGPSALAASLFAVHPLHVESVAWIAERKDVLSTAFWLAAMLAYVRYARAPRPRMMAVTALLMGAGLAAKPMLVSLPLSLLILDAWPLERVVREGWRRLLIEKLPLFALSTASCVVTLIVQRRGGALATLTEYPLGVRISNAVVSYAAYLGKTFWPVDLAVFYRHASGYPAPAAVAASAIALVGITALAWRARRKAPYVLAGWSWYVVTLFPVIGIVQVGDQAMADRYTYVPLIGIFTAIAWGADGLARRAAGERLAARALAAAGTLVIVILALLSRRQAAIWKDSITLFTHALQVAPESTTANVDLADALAAAGRTDEAIARFEAALRLEPGNRAANNQLAGILARRGEFDAAIGHCERALAAWPGDPETLSNLGIALARAGRLNEAEARFRQAKAADREGSAEIRVNLGNVLLLQGHLDDALASYCEALALDPEDPDTRASYERALERQAAGSGTAR